MWKEVNQSLVKTFSFDSFPSAIAWMVKASFLMEQQQHHAEWTNVYNKVHVTLRTHDAGHVVTEKDRQLAEALDRI
jgi:4a-hydroxytetrahydrobiopterin dehydratase